MLKTSFLTHTTFLTLLSLSLGAYSAHAQDATAPYGVRDVPTAQLPGSPTYLPDDRIPIGINRDYSARILEQRRDPTSTARFLLQAREAGMLSPNQLVISGSAAGFAMREYTNTDGKFGILSRFPNQHDTDGSGHDTILEYARLGTTVTLGDWVTGYAMLQYDELAYPHEPNTRMDQAFVTLGNLDVTPFYAFYGRKIVDFGHMGTYNPFTETTNSHGFRTESDDPVYGVGYYDGALDVVVTGMSGERQFRVASNSHNDTGAFGNFAVNTSYRFDLSDISHFSQEDSFTLGAGYLHSTIYGDDFTHHTRRDLVGAPITVNERNAAWDMYGELSYGAWMSMAEYTTTEDVWPASGHRVSTVTWQNMYRHTLLARPAEASLTLSRATFGEDGTEFERMDQHVLGYRWQGGEHWWLGAEYVYNKGFAPLINIRRTSDADVETHSLILGGRIWF